MLYRPLHQLYSTGKHIKVFILLETHVTQLLDARNSVCVLSMPFAYAYSPHSLNMSSSNTHTPILASKNAMQSVNFLVCYKICSPRCPSSPCLQGQWLLWLLLWHINKTVKVETTWQPFPLPFPLSRCLLLRQTVFNFISISDNAVFHLYQTRSRLKLTFFVDLSFCIYQKRLTRKAWLFFRK